MAIAGNYSTSFTPSSAGYGELGIVLVIVALVVSRRIYRGMKGTKFSTSAAYRLPAVYLLLTILELLAANPSIPDAVAAAAAIAAGLAAGLMIGGGVQFFEKDSATYYKRSPVIMVIWLASFLARFAVEVAYPNAPYIAVAVDIVLAGTTGLIIGEAFHIKRNYEAYRKTVAAQGS